MNVYKEKYINIKKDRGLFNVRVLVPHQPTDLQKKEGGIPTLGQAKAVARRFKEELLARRDKMSGGILTFSEAKEQYLAHCGSTFKPSGLYSLKTCLDAHTHHWNTKLITDFTHTDFWDLGSKMMETLEPSTVDRNIRHIRGVFAHLVRTGRIDRNPSANIKFCKTKSDKKLNAMSKAEIDLVLQYAAKIAHPLYPIIYLAYQTGARSGELKELRVSDFNFDDETVTISRSYCAKSKMAVATKSGRARALHLNSSAMNYVRGLAHGKAPNDFILPRFRPFIKGGASKLLKAIQTEVGVQQTNFHSIRASFITHLLVAGKPVTSVQEIVGHCDLKTTQRYVRMVASDLRGITDAIEIKTPKPRTELMDFTSALSSL
jgi:integrase